MEKIINEEKINRNYFAIIPATIRYDNDLCPNSKLLYGEITALCNEKGYCWASNEYFSNLYNVNIRTVKNWIRSLREKGYISVDIKREQITENGNITIKSKRKLTIIENIFQQLSEKKCTYNNTINNISILSENNFPLQEELKSNFNKLWEIYPKKENQTDAFTEYCLLLERFKKEGYEERSINRALWNAIDEYKILVEKQKREINYIKNANTFFKKINDYKQTLNKYLILVK